jgi:hypothetical protein
VSIDGELGFAAAPASTVKDIPSVLALVKEEVVRSLLHLDVKEVVKEADVC